MDGVMKLGIGSSSSPGPDITRHWAAIKSLSSAAPHCLHFFKYASVHKKRNTTPSPHSFLPLHFSAPSAMFSPQTLGWACVWISLPTQSIMTLGRNMFLSWNPGQFALGLLWVFLPHSVMLLGLSCLLRDWFSSHNFLILFSWPILLLERNVM